MWKRVPRYKVLALWVFVLLAASFVLMPVQFANAAIASSPPAQTPECDALMANLLSGDAWLDRLVDPILTSQEHINDYLELLSSAHSCLEDQTGSLTPTERELYRLIEYYMIFAGGYQTPDGASTLYLVDLSKSDDPAVKALRNQVGLPPPAGYIFVRFYTSRAAMPDLLQRAFDDPQVAGVTIYTRYVAILEEEKFTVEEQILQSQTLPGTHSHELVHAYINASLGPQNTAEMPIWYHEGIASYFSGSAATHRVEVPGGLTVVQVAPEDYQQYDLNFRYLEDEYGKSKLNNLVRQSVEQADARVLLTGLGISDEAQLIERALAWEQAFIRRRGLILAGMAILAVLALVNLPFLLSLFPTPTTFTCEWCNYEADRETFAGNRCPRCGRISSTATTQQRFTPLRSMGRQFKTRIMRQNDRPPPPARPTERGSAATCQVCGRVFQGDQAHQLIVWPHLVRIKVDQDDSDDTLKSRTIFVRRACRDCLGKSAELRSNNP
jgi:hypothetical protein